MEGFHSGVEQGLLVGRGSFFAGDLEFLPDCEFSFGAFAGPAGSLDVQVEGREFLADGDGS